MTPSNTTGEAVVLPRITDTTVTRSSWRTSSRDSLRDEEPENQEDKTPKGADSGDLRQVKLPVLVWPKDEVNCYQTSPVSENNSINLPRTEAVVTIKQSEMYQEELKALKENLKQLSTEARDLILEVRIRDEEAKKQANEDKKAQRNAAKFAENVPNKTSLNNGAARTTVRTKRTAGKSRKVSSLVSERNEGVQTGNTNDLVTDKRESNEEMVSTLVSGRDDSPGSDCVLYSKPVKSANTKASKKTNSNKNEFDNKTVHDNIKQYAPNVRPVSGKYNDEVDDNKRVLNSAKKRKPINVSNQPQNNEIRDERNTIEQSKNKQTEQQQIINKENCSEKEKEKVDGTANKVDGTANKVDGTANKVDGTANKVDGTASEVDGTANKVDRTANKVDGTANKVDGTANKVDGKANKVDGTASEVDGTANKVDGTANKVDGTANKVDGTASEVDETANKVDGTANKVDGTANKVDGTANKVDGKANKVDGTANKVDGTANEVDGTPNEEVDFFESQSLRRQIHRDPFDDRLNDLESVSSFAGRTVGTSRSSSEFGLPGGKEKKWHMDRYRIPKQPMEIALQLHKVGLEFESIRVRELFKSLQRCEGSLKKAIEKEKKDVIEEKKRIEKEKRDKEKREEYRRRVGANV
ncbi:hypothetical protein QZH41_004341 [Actinostola sp. cb2023]|nr:hypothetical protein QZH41_004341 [Actinostola sp. cb2023]